MARVWYNNGCRTLEDVKERVKLSPAQEIGLRYYRGACSTFNRRLFILSAHMRVSRVETSTHGYPERRSKRYSIS